MIIRGHEIRKCDNQIQFSLAVLDTTELRRTPKIGASNSARPSTREGIDLSGSHLLVVCVSALSAVSLLFWAFLKLWLSE